MGDATQNKINHVVLVLDASSSMQHRTAELVRVADNQIAYLAQRSRELNQETRITVHTFADPGDVKCVIWDMDVLRLPSIAALYRAYGWTALIDGAMLAISDMKLITEKYGDHAFLIYVLTDGAENSSIMRDPAVLSRTINALPGHWTVAALVPDAVCMHEAKQFGFPAQNVAVWDATTNRGVAEVGAVIRDATDRFMQGRAKGVRGTKALFSTDIETVNADTIKGAGLKPMNKNSYILTVVPPEFDGAQIRDFIRDACGCTYRVRRGYYELTKREKIQADKDIAILDKKTRKVYVGDGARQMVGLPDGQVSVIPDFNPDYKIMVQSGSVNRKLVVGTEVLYLV